MIAEEIGAGKGDGNWLRAPSHREVFCEQAHRAVPVSFGTKMDRKESIIAMLSRLFSLTAAALLTTLLVLAQASPRVTGVEPGAGKVDSNVTVSGENLGSDTVVGIYLSDDKADYPAMVVEQTAEKIVVKVPQVTPGGYNVSIHVGNNIFIQPVRFTVEQ